MTFCRRFANKAIWWHPLGRISLEESQMEALAHGHASYAHCYPQRLILCLEARLFLPHLWQQIRDWFSRAGSITWLSAPFRVMTAEGPTPDSPRWKQVGMDVLSWLIFLVMVPA